MSIIYSYPTSQPTVDDLLIGTDVADDNATKSFTVQSLVSLINAAQDNGILTSATIFTDAFLKAEGNPTGPAVAYTIGLAATGTPSATTFLRGDNQWVVPTVSAGILVEGDGFRLTEDVSSFNFTGEGITTNVVGNAITVSVAAQVQAITGLTPGAGIGLSSSTGNVVISNTGVRQIIGSNGISVTPAAGTGVVTLTLDNSTIGTVTSVTPGTGLKLQGTGTTTLNPVIGINYSGNQNYIIEGDSPTVALSTDKIVFNQASSNDIKTSTLGTVPMNTLPLVKTYIDTGDAPAVKNNTDSITSVAKATQVITLLDTEYAALSTSAVPAGPGYVANTLYLTTTQAPATQFRATLFVNNQVDLTNGYLTGNQTGNFDEGPEGSIWIFETGVAANPGFTYVPGNAPVTISGTLTANTTETITLTGSITQDSVPQCPVNLVTASSVTDPNGNLLPASYYNITSNGASYSGSCDTPLNNTIFNVGFAISTAGQQAGYSINPAAPINFEFTGNEGTYRNTNTVTATAEGAVVLGDFAFNVIVNAGSLSPVTGATFTIETSGIVAGTFSSVSSQTFSGTAASGTPYTQITTISSDNADVSGVVITSSSNSSGITTAGVTNITYTLTGPITLLNATMQLLPINSFTPVAAFPTPGSWGYQIGSGDRQVGLFATGPIGQQVVWTFLPNPPNVDSDYYITSQDISSPIGYLGQQATIASTATVTAALVRNVVKISPTGGSPGAGQPNPACDANGGAPIYTNAYTDSDVSNGVTDGMTIYQGPTGSQSYAGPGQSYAMRDLRINNQIIRGWATFGQNGVIDASGSC